MPAARYILRLDDACPTMNQETWNLLEQVLDELEIRPIVGVIPDNRDPALMISAMNPGFWADMRRWRDKGWEIVMHGLHHQYHHIPKGTKPLLPLSKKSEFVGLPLLIQKEMLSTGFSIMSQEGLRPRAFMAPSHTFDENTLLALREVTDIRIITDGHALFPYTSRGFTWLPQQLWRFRNLPFGIWCICLHPNTISESELLKLISDLRLNSRLFLDPNDALKSARPRSFLDFAFIGIFRTALAIKRRMNNLHG